MAYKSEDIYEKDTTAEIAVHVKEILRLLGEDTEREGLLKTPERVAKSLQFLTKGYSQNGEEVVRSAIFDEEYQQMVLPAGVKRFGLTAGLPVTLEGLVGENGKVFGLNSFGFSAPYKVLDEKLGFTAQNVYNQVKELLNN